METHPSKLGMQPTQEQYSVFTKFQIAAPLILGNRAPVSGQPPQSGNPTVRKPGPLPY